ncbi:unnamed protein product, partial [marine sediment metagenome]
FVKEGGYYYSAVDAGDITAEQVEKLYDWLK